MPRYFFSLHDHVFETDNVGVELADTHAARLEAIRFGGEVLRDQPELLDDTETLVVEVTCENGSPAFQLEMRAVDPND